MENAVFWEFGFSQYESSYVVACGLQAGSWGQVPKAGSEASRVSRRAGSRSHPEAGKRVEEACKQELAFRKRRLPYLMLKLHGSKAGRSWALRAGCFVIAGIKLG